jgi:hypothetical protein
VVIPHFAQANQVGSGADDLIHHRQEPAFHHGAFLPDVELEHPDGFFLCGWLAGH